MPKLQCCQASNTSLIFLRLNAKKTTWMRLAVAILCCCRFQTAKFQPKQVAHGLYEVTLRFFRWWQPRWWKHAPWLVATKISSKAWATRPWPCKSVSVWVVATFRAFAWLIFSLLGFSSQATASLKVRVSSTTVIRKASNKSIYQSRATAQHSRMREETVSMGV